MKGETFGKLGGACSILVGISYVLIGVTYLLIPREQQSSNPARFYPSLAQDPTLLKVENWAFALGAVIAIAAVLAISERVRAEREGWLRWASTLAVIGLAVTAINAFRFLALEPGRAAAYVGGDEVTRAVIGRTAPLMNLDPDGWLGFGGVGLWVLVVSLLMRRQRAFPTLLSYVGILVAILYSLVVAGLVIGGPASETLIAIAAGLGGVVAAPIWYIWMGLRLRRS